MTGYLLGGAIVVEQVFAIPGLGRLILGAIAERNYPLLQARSWSSRRASCS